MAPPTASNESLQQHSWGKSRKDHHGGSPGSLYERDSSSGQASSSTRSKSRKRTRRCALDKARQAALSYTLEVSDGMKAFDGPPLGPQDVKDLLRRNFRIAMSTSEAVALIKDFRHDEAKRMNVTSAYQRRTEQSYLRQQQVTIELGEFLHRLLNMRRKLLKARTKNMTDGRRKPASVRISAYEPGAVSQACKSSSSLNFPSDGHRIVMNSGRPRGSRLNMDILVQALTKVDRAAVAYDSRRIENLRQADLTRAISPRAFAGVLLARFDVRADPLEQSELTALLQDASGVVDVERFRSYFLSLTGIARGKGDEMDQARIPPLTHADSEQCPKECGGISEKMGPHL